MNTKILTSAIAITSIAVSAVANPEASHRGDRPSPEDLVVDIFTDYDANTDDVINVVELESALVGIHEKRVALMKERAAERGIDGDGPRRRGPRGDRAAPDPAKMAARMVADFDDNGDSVLDTEELMVAMKAIHSRGPGKGPRGPRGRGADAPSSASDVE